MNIGYSELVTVLSLLAAIFAWVSKLVWGGELLRAKNETIKLKETEILSHKTKLEEIKEIFEQRHIFLKEQIARLEGQTPELLVSKHRAIKESLEELIQELEDKVKELNLEISIREDDILNLQEENSEMTSSIEIIQEEKESLLQRVNELSEYITGLKSSYKFHSEIILEPRLLNKDEYLSVNVDSTKDPKEIIDNLDRSPIARLKNIENSHSEYMLPSSIRQDESSSLEDPSAASLTEQVKNDNNEDNLFLSHNNDLKLDKDNKSN